MNLEEDGEESRGRRREMREVSRLEWRWKE